MRHLQIVLAVLEQKDNYLLQLRGDNPAIGGAGLIGCFGGKIEKDETAVDAVCREVAEETSFAPKATDAQLVGEVNVTSDHKNEDVTVNAQVFSFKVPTNHKVRAKEGTLVTLDITQALAKRNDMTTGTRAVFEELIGDKS